MAKATKRITTRRSTTKTTTPAKRKPTDATMRNVRATGTRLTQLRNNLGDLGDAFFAFRRNIQADVTSLRQRVVRLEEQLHDIQAEQERRDPRYASPEPAKSS